MEVEIIAVFIPIVFFLGLFTAITLNIYYKYKTNSTMSERVPLETLGEWYRSESHRKSLRNRGNSLRWGGFFAGMGLGVAIGCIAIACGGLSTLAERGDFDRYAIATFLVISLAVFCAGLGMVGAYFLERKLDKTNK